ncbi:MAG: serine/threonine-protein kinase [Gemmataceae bacterium]
MRFTYRMGEQPLAGFTLKRGIGRGGFGEVYLALSDGGKEVALKLLHGDPRAELRGVTHCLNLKHPRLVWLYDLRVDGLGNHWVVMEYITGKTLAAHLRAHPSGLPSPEVRRLALEILEAIEYLHDCGVVHRDLKPANIFLENGHVKIGDHGLAKGIGPNQSVVQTASVGTIHYMAPEISRGNYTSQIDLYAIGILLYEMLTGSVPYQGDSYGEILIKHLTAAPALDRLPVEWREIVGKALAKNPQDRYASAAEMALAIKHLGGPLPQPSGTVPLATPIEPASPPPSIVPGPSPWMSLIELSWSFVLAALWTGLATLLAAAIGGDALPSFFFTTLLACWGVLILARCWKRPKLPETSVAGWSLGTALLGGLVGLAAMWIDGHVFFEMSVPRYSLEAHYVSYYAFAFFFIRWWDLAARQRMSRFQLTPVVGAGASASLLLLLARPAHPHSFFLAVAIVVAVSVIVQLASPWEPPPELLAPSKADTDIRFA